MKTPSLLSAAVLLALGTAASAQTPPANTPNHDPAPGTVNPLPATSPLEGTAADHTPPGETPVRGTNAATAPSQVTTRMAAGAAEMSAQLRASRLIGREVRSSGGASLGVVRDVLISDDGRVTGVVFAPGNGQMSNDEEKTTQAQPRDSTAGDASRSTSDSGEASGSESADHAHRSAVSWDVRPSAVPWDALSKKDASGALVVDESRVQRLDTGAKR